MESNAKAIAAHFFLIENNLVRTVDLLGRELNSTAPVTHEEWHLRILSAYDAGSRNDFFEHWERYIPGPLKTGEYEKLEFFTQIYFTCLPLMQGNRERWNSELVPFKEFLNSKGAEFCKTTEFLPLYALPHIQNPQQHTTFKKYFSVSWAKQLRSRLQNYLVGLLDQAAPAVQNPPNLQRVSLEQELDRAKNREEYMRSALVESNSKWTGFAFNLLTLSKQLLGHINGTNEANVPFVSSKLHEYEKFLMSSEDSVSNASSFLPVLHKDNLPNVSYAIVKRDIFDLTQESRGCALLQALRWRLTKTPSSVRRAVLEDYANCDLFSTAENGLSGLLSKGSQRLTDYTAKLANVMASEPQGRSYLLQDSRLILVLVAVLKKELQDTVLRQNSIGILQKLSLRRKPQSLMIECNMIEWLVTVLASHESLTEYTLEYSAALLMNLSLRTSGKNICENLQILPLLGTLMEHENPNVRTYVNGILYSIFSRKPIKESAKILGFVSGLEQLHQVSEEAFQKQIFYVLEQLKNEYEDSVCSEEEADEDDLANNPGEESDMVSDDEDMEELIEQSGLLGEELLKQYALDESLSRSLSKPQQNFIDNSYLEGDRFRQSITPASNEFSEFMTAFKPRSKIPRTPVLKE